MARIITLLVLTLTTALLALMPGWADAITEVAAGLVPLLLIVGGLWAWVTIRDRRFHSVPRRQGRTGPWI